MSTDLQPESARGGGRKRDASRDKAILKATIDVVADSGYMGLTMDAVAQRAGASKATLYRRWDSKSALVRDAMIKLQEAPGLPEDLPDSGSLRDDLIALFVTVSPEDSNRRVRVMLGLASVLAHDESVADIGDAAIVAPWAAACRCLIEQAASRGEVSTDGVDVNMLSRIIPAMAVSRIVLERRIADQGFVAKLVDGVVMPALMPS